VATMRVNSSCLPLWVIIVVVVQLLASAGADVVTGEDLVYSEAWGTQSACSGCSYVKGQVIERAKEEVSNDHSRQSTCVYSVSGS
jgi:hypothetical protein